MRLPRPAAIAPYAKALASGVTSGLFVWYNALDDDILTSQEQVGIAAAFMAGLGIVYAVPNRSDLRHRDSS